MISGLNYAQTVCDRRRRILEVWNSTRASRSAPVRTAINPGMFADALSDISLIDRGQDGAFRYRLAGSRICDRIQRELRGVKLTDLNGEDRALLWPLAAGDAICPFTPLTGRRWLSQEELHIWLRLPVSSDGEAIDMVLGFDRFIQQRRSFNSIETRDEVHDLTDHLSKVHNRAKRPEEPRNTQKTSSSPRNNDVAA